ncbi:hypothetical protein [Vannielia sp.]|uniref:nickel/cobalt transporter n=1 Tax=Vannielia sp. TaxID=2813045 RepID=UPI002622C4D0|nr:hypothetical protein [Vannielia sp.]MDF1871467.1 hypothetical protein [Vannielia sp.]
MRRGLILLLLIGAVAGLGAAWALGGFDALASWAEGVQREAQGAMARSLRALKGGQPGALWALIGLAFTYGVAHAAGPGHGKVLLGGYGLGRRVPVGRLAAIALASSLAQAGSAVLLVYAAITLLGWTGRAVEGLTEAVLAPLSYAAIGAIGLWLLWRGVRGLIQQREAQGGHGHGHDHEHQHGHGHDHAGQGEVCESCGHAHGPTIEQVEAAGSLRDVLILVGGIAIRPCTGALFLLIITWRLGIGGVGVAGAFAMGLGTALVTIMVAVVAVVMREGAWASVISRGGTMRMFGPVLEIVAGLVVAVVASQMVWRAL